MLFLIIDDSTNRYPVYKNVLQRSIRWLKDKDIICVTNSADAIAVLETRKPLAGIILDGDLGENDSGEKVVKWLQENPYSPTNILVSSMNPVKNKRMVQNLTDLEFNVKSTPFSSWLGLTDD